MLYRVSRAWAKIELWAAAGLAAAVTLLILLNVVTRYFGSALFWVDELAIYAMVWMTFLGASLALHHRSSVSVTFLVDTIPAGSATILKTLVDLVVFAFALSMLYFCWRWYSPLELARAGFDIQRFQGTTFNFIYAEPTSTLGIPKYLFWLVMWLFAFGATLHSATHLLSPKEADT